MLRFRKIVYNLSTPLGRRGLRLGVGASVEHKAALRGRKFRSIVDVGANRGQFSLFARMEFPEARIASFEPLSSPANIFEALFKDEHGISLHRIGLGRRNERMCMHVTEHDDSSSILAPASVQVGVFGTNAVGREDVAVARLDSVLGQNDIERPALLKIDTQGYELEVIVGCGDLIRSFDCIYAELSFVELYKGQPLFDDVSSVLLLNGFRLAGVFNQVSDELGRALQADFIFVNTGVANLP